ncbi:MmgE/PrpD family protein [Arthrobacter sp. NPDC055585]
MTAVPAGAPAAAGAETVQDAVRQLAGFAAELTYDTLPAPVLDRLPVMLTDLLGVTIAGNRTPEMRAVLAAWRSEPGTRPVLGTDAAFGAEQAALLNAAGACCLELDEGNKHAQGHPAVHVVFAALAAAQLQGETVSGQRFLTAVAAGYEVAARFGQAMTRHPDWHPHGHWGATGAACAAALISGLPASRVAAAMDAAAGLVNAAPWQLVLDGNFTRNFWAGGANLAGLHAARLSAAGVVGNSGAAAAVLGGLAGTLEPTALVRDLGTDWLLSRGYSKLHSSCSFTHGAVDLALELREETADRSGAVSADSIDQIRVITHSLAAPLFGIQPDNRLSGMFSYPFVLSVALLQGEVTPATMDPEHPGAGTARTLAEKVTVQASPEYDALLPGERRSCLEIRWANGRVSRAESPNPRGDADFHPLDAAGVQAKLSALLGARSAQRVAGVVHRLPDAADTAGAFTDLQFEGDPT